jgi:hypothetical protein
MWLPNIAFELFQVSKESVDKLREDLATVRAERDLLKIQLASSQNHFDWLRIRVNALEVERAQLIEKAYGIKIPVPEVIRQPVMNPLDMGNALFEDVGDKIAKELGMPLYNN